MASDDRFSAYAGRVSTRAASNKETGGGGFTGGGGSNENKGTGQGSVQEVSSTGHDLLDQYNKLVAEGKGDTTQAQELARYLGKVEQKYQSKGESLFGPVNPNEATMIAGQNPFTNLDEKGKVELLASMEAGDPFDPENKYYKSSQGEKFREWALAPKEEGGGGFTKDDPGLKQAWDY